MPGLWHVCVACDGSIVDWFVGISYAIIGRENQVVFTCF